MRTRRYEKLISIQAGQEKNYEMCESRAEVKQDDIGVFLKIYDIFMFCAF
jgi:hypothetical protein